MQYNNLICLEMSELFLLLANMGGTIEYQNILLWANIMHGISKNKIAIAFSSLTLLLLL
jgi:hypothetical protein